MSDIKEKRANEAKETSAENAAQADEAQLAADSLENGGAILTVVEEEGREAGIEVTPPAACDRKAPPAGDYVYRIFGFIVLAVCFGSIGGWAAFAPLESAVVVSGQVRDESKIKIVQHLEGGLVEEILTEDGDLVKKGQALLRLNDTQIRTQLEEVHWQYLVTLATTDRFEAEQNGLDTVVFSPELQEDDIIVQKMLAGERRLLTFRRDAFNSEIGILNQRVQQLEAQISGLEKVQLAKQERIDAFAADIEEWQSLFEKQLVDKQQLRQIRQQQLILEGDVAGQKAEISRLRIKIGETKLQIVQHRRSFMSDIAQNLKDTQFGLADLKLRMNALRERVDHAEILAPADGVIVGMTLHTIGAVIAPGQEILKIVPQTNRFIIDVMIPITDIDTVAVGLNSDIRFSAFATRTRAVIDGIVVDVDAGTTVDPRSGASYYKGTIEVLPGGLKDMQDENITLISGMPAEVIIKTGSRSLLAYIIQPFSDMIAKSFREE